MSDKEFRTTKLEILQIRTIGTKRWRNICSKEGCNTQARDGYDRCKACGGGLRCSTVGCKTAAVDGYDRCKACGGGKRCSTEGCNNAARSGYDICGRCGGGKLCSTEGCKKSTQGRSDKCIRCGGGKRCSTEGCKKSTQGRSDKCIRCGGGLRCSTKGCKNSAIGGYDKCGTCGGGLRCSTEGCKNLVINGYDKCMKHGAGLRCSTNGCKKFARPGYGKCVGCGGGKRCSTEGCKNGAISGYDKCRRCGGGKRCSTEGCGKPIVSKGLCYGCSGVRYYCSTEGCKKLAKYDGLCRSCGGVKICSTEGCEKAVASKGLCFGCGGGTRCEHHEHIICELEPFPPFAKYKDHITNKFLCWQHYHSLVLGNNTCKAIRRELLFLGSILCNPYREIELRDHYIGSDFNIYSCNLLRRPDMLFVFNTFALLIEFDENGHKNRKELSEILHLQVISQWINETYNLTHIHVIRVNPDGKYPMYKKKQASNKEFIWDITKNGEEKTNKILFELSPVIDSGLDNLPIPEKCFDEKISCDESGNTILLTFKRY